MGHENGTGSKRFPVYLVQHGLPDLESKFSLPKTKESNATTREAVASGRCLHNCRVNAGDMDVHNENEAIHAIKQIT